MHLVVIKKAGIWRVKQAPIKGENVSENLTTGAILKIEDICPAPCAVCVFIYYEIMYQHTEYMHGKTNIQ